MVPNKTGACYHIWRNLFGFFMTRPPVAIMVLFVGALSLSLLSLAYYIQYNHIMDYDATKNFDDLLQRFVGLTFCLTNVTKQLSKTNIQKEVKIFGEADFINISFPLTALPSVQGSFSHTDLISEITGVVPYFLLFQRDEHFHSIAVDMFLKTPWHPANCSTHCPSTEACVSLQIKASALPPDFPYSMCNPSEYKSNHSTIYMHTQKSEKTKRSECNTGLQMSFDQNGYLPKVYLNTWEKSKVNVRLRVASYIIFVLLLSCLIYAVMKGRASQGSKSLKVLQS